MVALICVRPLHRIYIYRGGDDLRSERTPSAAFWLLSRSAVACSPSPSSTFSFLQIERAQGFHSMPHLFETWRKWTSLYALCVQISRIAKGSLLLLLFAPAMKAVQLRVMQLRTHWQSCILSLYHLMAALTAEGDAQIRPSRPWPML